MPNCCFVLKTGKNLYVYESDKHIEALIGWSPSKGIIVVDLPLDSISPRFKKIQFSYVHFPYINLGCPNRLSSVDRFLYSRCQSCPSCAWWRNIFKEAKPTRRPQWGPMLPSTTI